MLRAVVDDRDAVRRQSCDEASLDFGGDAAHIGVLSLPGSRRNRSHNQAAAPHTRFAVIPADAPKRQTRFHGRVERPEPARCDHPGCPLPGEFRAPRSNRVPGEVGGWQFLCLDHVRAFNAGYNYFDGLSPDEIYAEQSPLAGWEKTSVGRRGREAFTFADPHDLFGAGGSATPRGARVARRWNGSGDQQALGTLGLTDAATSDEVRRAYKRLVRRYHPDSNGGDRSMEGKLQAVVNAYTHLRAAPAFDKEP